MANKSFVVQYLIKARSQFNVAAEKTKRASEGMRKSINKTKGAFAAASLKIKESARKMRSAMQKASQKFQQVAGKMRNAGVVMSAAITLPLGLAARSLKNAARDAEETRSKFATVFRDVSAQSKASADNLKKNFGLSGSAAQQLLADTGDLLSGFGFTGESALDLSTQVNELAVDLASFTNFSGGAKGASDALTKALLGERESVKSLGIAILEKDVKARVSKMLAEGQTFASERQAKAQATLSLALEQSKNAIGDFARTQHQLANQERITSSRIQDLKESFGRILLPVALKVTKAIGRIAEKLENLGPGAKKAILIVAAVVAAIGPLLLIIGSIGLALPALTAGFAVFGITAATALGPLGLIAAAIALAAILIIANWDKVAAFFRGFADGMQSSVGPTIGRLIDRFREAATIVAQLFGADGQATKDLSAFTNAGQLVGEIVGGALDLLIRGLSGIGAILGQLIGSIATMNFGQFDLEAIKAEFMGTPAQPVLAESRVDVGVNVGLAAGLQQTAPAQVAGAGVRRTDVGGVTP